MGYPIVGDSIYTRTRPNAKILEPFPINTSLKLCSKYLFVSADQQCWKFESQFKLVAEDDPIEPHVLCPLQGLLEVTASK